MAKRYRNIGVAPLVFDREYQPGEEFTVGLPPELEFFLLQGGHIQVLDAPEPEKKEA